MKKVTPHAWSMSLATALALVILLISATAAAQWAAGPGATHRNAFGPEGPGGAAQCRGACGGGCPDSCAQSVSFECAGEGQLRRVVIYDCGTHPGCRVHDDCLDECLSNSAQGGNCQKQCDADVMNQFGMESSASWLMGSGPYDGRATFEYTRNAPDALEPAYRCPDGASQQCSGAVGCALPGGKRVEPVFSSYPAAGAGAMRVSAFRSGMVCGDGVCQQTADIDIYGEDSCPGGDCTRFGMEFDYANADPSMPLECTTSTSGGESDFVGGLLKQGADTMQSRGTGEPVDGKGEDGMAELMGLFGQVLASAESPEDVNISMAPLGADGKPIESQRVGSTPRNGPPPIPPAIDLPAVSGHLFVPMYQLVDGMQPGQTKERRLRCTHKGVPVLETTFRLHST